MILLQQDGAGRIYKQSWMHYQLTSQVIMVIMQCLNVCLKGTSQWIIHTKHHCCAGSQGYADVPNGISNTKGT